MTEIVIGNEFKRRLNDISSEFFSMSPNKEKYWSFNDSDTSMTDGEYYCSDESLEKKLSKGKDHEGFPEEYLAQPISKMVEEDPEIWMHFRNKVKFDFAKEIGAHSSALLSYYPPGGHVGWHTNWNANAYQVLFTYSKTGDGYFRYLDKVTDKIVTIQDVKGWQCRHYYFGRVEEENSHCWHSAYAGGERLTLAYKFSNKSLMDDQNEKAIMMRDLAIEEIME
jgi:hypothetical protein